MTTKRVKFVQLLTMQSSYGGATALAAGGTYSVLYALDDDGRVWVYADNAWSALPEPPAQLEAPL